MPPAQKSSDALVTGSDRPRQTRLQKRRPTQPRGSRLQAILPARSGGERTPQQRARPRGKRRRGPWSTPDGDQRIRDGFLLARGQGRPSSRAATPGLGQAFTLALAKAGADVFVPSVMDDDGKTGPLVRQPGRRYEFLKTDITAPGAARNVIDTCVERFGGSTSSSTAPASARWPRCSTSAGRNGTRPSR